MSIEVLLPVPSDAVAELNIAPDGSVDWPAGFPLSNALALFVTFNAVCFGLLIFSGHIGTAPKTQQISEKVSKLKNAP